MHRLRRRNRERMRYPEFRAAGLCTSTGVVEAGCKVAIGTRCKRAGMHWTVAGANAIIALRCCSSAVVRRVLGAPCSTAGGVMIDSHLTILTCTQKPALSGRRGRHRVKIPWLAHRFRHSRPTRLELWRS